MNKEYLEALERMCSTTLEEDLSVRDIYETEYGIVEQALQRLEAIDKEQRIKELKYKCWDIVKEKRIDIESFYSSFIERDFTYDFYSSFYGSYGRNKLTKVEFNLMIEALV